MTLFMRVDFIEQNLHRDSPGEKDNSGGRAEDAGALCSC